MTGTGERPRRGRPPRIGREQVVAAAVELGVDALTMTAVAERLGVSHQALYRWVRDRDELIALVADVYVQRLVLPPPSTDWRGWLRTFAIELYEKLSELPGFATEGLGAFRTSLPFLRLNEQATRVLVDAGFAPLRAQRIYQTFGTALLGWIAREDAYRALREQPDRLERPLATITAVAGDELELVAETALAELMSPPAERYGFLVDALLAGLPEPEQAPGS
jgi:AcrR family transcriptional regulator